MTPADLEEFSYRLRLALRTYGEERTNSKGETATTCVFEKLYINDRACRIKAHVYANSDMNWAESGTAFTRIFEEPIEGPIFAIPGAVDYFLPILREGQLLDQLADL